MAVHTLLIIDDEQAQRESLAGFLAKKGYQIQQAALAQEAIEIVQRMPVDLLLTDLRMPGMDGRELLQKVKGINPEVEVIVMTAFGSLESAVAAMKEGALDFLTKPIDLQQLELIVAKAIERKQLLSENARLRELVQEQQTFQGIITSSPLMQESLSIAGRAAESKATVLILGESGTGKELVAKAIHLAGPRRDKPFVAVNMAALPEQLLESEMFGHEKGAFTGAEKFRQGRFEMAHSGTLFIDEVGDIPAGLQVKLLRVLQSQSFERLGSSQPIQVDVRLIAATHRNLETLVKEGAFRQDLYYRLNVVQIRLPALRERRMDIPALANQFLKRFARLNEKPVHGFSREAMDLLLKHDYPGNVRELENMVEQAVVLCRDELITSRDLPLHALATPSATEPEAGASFQEQVAWFEKKLILEALQAAAGNQSKAAARLGMGERHLRYKLKKYGMK
ncbi:sigma-54-dependent Fis family transcriptional regulator [bacterium]|nr:sigma-54-dependent Fis family transcriptional regulator [bacterium]